MPILPSPLASLGVSLYGETPIYSAYPAPSFPSSPAQVERPATPLNKLRQLGMPKTQAQRILNDLKNNNDHPYHAGKLLNGKVYVITQKDRVYYGKPNNLVELENIQAHRSKCFNQQIRKYRTPDGLAFTITALKSQPQLASVTTRVLGFKMPIPHRSQIALSTNPRLPKDAFVPQTLSTLVCANDNPH